MRYAEYHKRLACLDKQIADCLRREARAAAGASWYFKMIPSLAANAIAAAADKRSRLARKRAMLDRDTFAAASLLWNADPVAVFRRNVPASDEAVDQLRAVADAAFDLNK